MSLVHKYLATSSFTVYTDQFESIVPQSIVEFSSEVGLIFKSSFYLYPDKQPLKWTPTVDRKVPDFMIDLPLTDLAKKIPYSIVTNIDSITIYPQLVGSIQYYELVYFDGTAYISQSLYNAPIPNGAPFIKNNPGIEGVLIYINLFSIFPASIFRPNPDALQCHLQCNFTITATIDCTDFESLTNYNGIPSDVCTLECLPKFNKGECLSLYTKKCFDPTSTITKDCADYFLEYTSKVGDTSAFDLSLNNYCQTKYPSLTELLSQKTPILDKRFCACRMKTTDYPTYLIPLEPIFGSIEGDQRCVISDCVSNPKFMPKDLVCANTCVNIVDMTQFQTNPDINISIKQDQKCQDYILKYDAYKQQSTALAEASVVRSSNDEPKITNKHRSGEAATFTIVVTLSLVIFLAFIFIIVKQIRG